MPLARTALNLMCRSWGRTLGRMRSCRIILCYHNVGNGDAEKRGWLAPQRCIDAGLFERQMSWLKQNYEVVTLDRLRDPIDDSRKSRVAITFDDGYLNNIEIAMPILERLELPMTWFVATAFVDDPGKLPWWDMIDLLLTRDSGRIRLHSPEVAGDYDLAAPADRRRIDRHVRQVLKASCGERRETLVAELGDGMRNADALPENAFARPQEVAAVDPVRVEIGGHTINHPNLAACESDRLHDEIEGGKRRLEAITGRQPQWFAYPYGGRGSFDARAVDAVRAAGFVGAVTLLPGIVADDSDPYRLPRIPISAANSLADFKARVEGVQVYLAAERLRRALRRA